MIGRTAGGDEVPLASLAGYTYDYQLLQATLSVTTPVRWVRVSTASSPGFVGWTEIELYSDEAVPAQGTTWGKIKSRYH